MLKQPEYQTPRFKFSWERLASRVFDITTHVKTTRNEVFLTFDDGPHPTITPWVLDVLDQYQAKATFFCVGLNVQQYPQVFEEIKKRGHVIGNHTFSHKNGLQTCTKNYLHDVDRVQTLIPTKLFRPPYGKMTIWQYLALKKRYKLIFWDVLSKDYDPTIDFRHIIGRVMQKTLPGSILVFHDSERAANALKKTLPIILEKLNMRAFEFKALA